MPDAGTFLNYLKKVLTYVRSNPVHGFEVRDFWRVLGGYQVWKCSKLGFSGFGTGIGPFLAEQVQSSGFLKGFERV